VSGPLTFVDTNVFVYAHDATEPAKQRRAEAFIRDLWADESGVVSTQVLEELYSVLTRKLQIVPAEARRIVTPFSAWQVVQIDVPLLTSAMLRNQQDAVSWRDCLIVEAALRAGARRLATEDLQYGRTFDGTLHVVDPMAA
jgi:predicted nucleic acid-binding protein